jgi:hypothetical protein
MVIKLSPVAADVLPQFQSIIRIAPVVAFRWPPSVKNKRLSKRPA